LAASTESGNGGAERKALVSAAGSHMADVLALAAVTFEKFAATHNYDLVLDDDFDDSPIFNDSLNRQAKWRKVDLFECLLPDYDLVVWFDADMVIKRFDRDIAEDVPQDCFQALVLEQYPHRFNPNCGVWAMRNDEMSYRFLEKIRQVDAPEQWNEQAAVCVALGWEVEKRIKPSDPSKYKTYAKPAYPSEFLPRTGWLRPEWNPVGFAAKWRSRTEHFASMSNAERIVKMQQVLDTLDLDAVT
jgi:hypothetical protein